MDARLQAQLALCRDLPTLPAVAVQVLQLANQPDCDLAELADILSNDPALATKMLRVANSAIYGRRRRTDNLRQALVVLGLNTTISLALSFSLRASLGQSGECAVDMERYWRRAIVAATASRALGERLSVRSLDDLFLAGLVQDIGMFALDAMLPDAYESVYGAARDHDHLAQLEAKEFGADHAEIGAWLMSRWQLPAHLPLSAAGSHRPEGAAVVPDESKPIVACVALSGRIADVLMSADTDATETIADLRRKSASWLQLDEKSLAEVLESAADAMQEIGRLFDVRLQTRAQVQGALDEARTLLLARNLSILQESAATRERAEKLEEHVRTLEEERRRDALTGLFNRNHLDSVLAREFQHSTRQGWPLTLAFIDLDHFKQINDTYGHQVGDQALASMAHLLRRELRGIDILARYGGEEFVALLPGTGRRAGWRVFDRLLQSIRTASHNVRDDVVLFITVSIGLATHLDDGEQFENHHLLLRAADRALYAAKRGGRDRLVDARELGSD